MGMGDNAARLLGVGSVDAVTTEYVGGVARTVTQKFRAYSSYAESFSDYAKLLTNNPRYAKTLTAGTDAAKFDRSRPLRSQN